VREEIRGRSDGGGREEEKVGKKARLTEKDTEDEEECLEGHARKRNEGRGELRKKGEILKGDKRSKGRGGESGKTKMGGGAGGRGGRRGERAERGAREECRKTSSWWVSMEI
jgi:hypothetical protein